MEQLLRWGITNSDPNAPPPTATQRQALDPGVIDAILGKSDAEKMKEYLTIGADFNQPEELREQSLDEFELLVEQIDNANNIEKLKMWEPLHSLLTSSSSPDSIVRMALWIIGTALQNNPSAQDSYIKYKPLPTLVSFLSSSGSHSSETRSRAMYAISGLLKHNAPAVRQLEDCGGWEKLREALLDPNLAIRKKTVFLLASILHPTSTPTPTPALSAVPPPSTSIPSTSTSVTLASPSSSSTTDNLHTPNEIHHPNSHRANLVDPSRTETSPPTLSAVKAHNILQTVVDLLTSKVPHGPDGDQEPDTDFEEKAVGFLNAYLVECHGEIGAEDKEKLKAWFSNELKNGLDVDGKWGLSGGERKALVQTVQ